MGDGLGTAHCSTPTWGFLSLRVCALPSKRTADGDQDWMTLDKLRRNNWDTGLGAEVNKEMETCQDLVN